MPIKLAKLIKNDSINIKITSQSKCNYKIKKTIED